MPRPCSMDLRERLVAAVDAGESRRSAACRRAQGETPELTLAGKAFRGQVLEKSFESVYAFREDGSWGEVYSYKLSAAEFKRPLQKAVADAGWGWKGVAFGL